MIYHAISQSSNKPIQSWHEMTSGWIHIWVAWMKIWTEKLCICIACFLAKFSSQVLPHSYPPPPTSFLHRILKRWCSRYFLNLTLHHVSFQHQALLDMTRYPSRLLDTKVVKWIFPGFENSCLSWNKDKRLTKNSIQERTLNFNVLLRTMHLFVLTCFSLLIFSHLFYQHKKNLKLCQWHTYTGFVTNIMCGYL